MKLYRLLYSILLLFLFQTVASASASDEVIIAVSSGQDSTARISRVHEYNGNCLQCHGTGATEHKYDTTGNHLKSLMGHEPPIDRNRFYRSNHKTFRCTDCHSKEFTKFPHALELKKEEKPECLECHGYDEKYAGYHFEDIESEYQASVHYGIKKKTFTCWDCHDSHYYKVSRPDSSTHKQIILYDNVICLNCHDNYQRFKQYSDTQEISISKAHKWLPDRTAHFRNVRCIECHAEIKTAAPVAHLINTKEKAVRDCKTCHSKNSILKNTIYRFNADQKPGAGFDKKEIINRAFIIGASGNAYLDMTSFVVFSLTILAIGIHITARVIYRHKN